MTFPRAYERTSDRLLQVQSLTVTRPYVKFVGTHVHVGTQSRHRERASRQWRMFWRLKALHG
jgi:hypothetical protein